MPRTARAAVGGVVYHVINRGNGRSRIFHKPADYDAYVKILIEGLEVVPTMRVLAFCLMPNHWHLVLWPRHDGDLSRYLAWVSNTHVRRYRRHYHDEGRGGHLYQGRFKSFPVQSDGHLLTVLRYVEANALRTKLAKNAMEWRWTSFAHRATGEEMKLLSGWPVDRPTDWQAIVERDPGETELDRVRLSLKRGRPFGDARWVQRTAKRLGLEFTLRPRGRPPKPKRGSDRGNTPTIGRKVKRQ